MQQINISPKILKWARISSHLPETIVVEHFNKKTKQQFKVDLPELKRLESQANLVSLQLLKEFASLYKRPLAMFFLDVIPDEESLPEDHRTLYSDEHKVLSFQAILAARTARRIQHIYQDLESILKLAHQKAIKTYSINDNPKELAKEFRNKFDFSFEKQKKLKDPLALFNFLRSTAEEFGIITLKYSFPMTDARAFSMADTKPYVIVINNKDGDGFSYNPKIFSLMHEFAHILLRKGAICNDYIAPHIQLEKFCNTFASSFLVPDDEFIVEMKKLTNKFEVQDLENYVKELKIIFKVSKDVILNKFLFLKFIDQSFYDELQKKWKSAYDNRDKAKTGFIPRSTPETKVLNSYGSLFVNVVFEAYSTEKISYDNISDYLNINTKFIPKLEKRLASSV